MLPKNGEERRHIKIGDDLLTTCFRLAGQLAAPFDKVKGAANPVIPNGFNLLNGEDDVLRAVAFRSIHNVLSFLAVNP